MAITISVPATKADFDGFGYVLWKSWHETYTGLIDPDYLAGITLERAQAAANRTNTNPELGQLIAKDGERVVGIVGFGPCRDSDLPGAGEVYAIYVLAEYHNQKIGYALMQAAFERLDSYDTIAVWALRENTRALRFYERFGFRYEGTDRELVLGKPVPERRMVYRRG